MGTILLTGAAGFIGHATAHVLVEQGHKVIGVDNFNDYYDPQLKLDRAAQLKEKCEIIKCDISDYLRLEKVFDTHQFDQVCHLAAQAGVRYSLSNPFAYEMSNNVGTLNILELCRHKNVNSLIYASSSSVYGGNTKVPFSVEDRVDHPISLYAATKKYNELMAHTYHHLYGIHTTGLRLFTVYGPWGRPDMALFKFTKAILEGQPLDVYNAGKMKRDFTYISDIVKGIVSALDKNYPSEIFNLGNSKSEELSTFIEVLEDALGKKAQKNLMDIQPGDVAVTHADIHKSTEKLGFKPTVQIDAGIKQFVQWYRDYFKQ